MSILLFVLLINCSASDFRLNFLKIAPGYPVIDLLQSFQLLNIPVVLPFETA